MRTKLSISILVMLAVSGAVYARIAKSWTYQEMFDNADLVVIARAVSSKDTDERTVLPDLNPPVKVIGVVTEFETRLVLKGLLHVATFQLHHYRIQSEEDRMIANGPDLLRLSGHNERFLLFLVKERDGKYAPVGGQTDPAGLSVLELGGSAR
jgi:hypothetical protein